MSRGSRIVLIVTMLLFSWMTLSDWRDDTPKARAIEVALVLVMLLLAIGFAFPKRAVLAFRVVAGSVAALYLWYTIIEITSLLRGEPQQLRFGQPSATMAVIGLLVFGVPAFVFAFGGVTTGWLDRLLRRMRDSNSPHE
jgi:hypothetical protein